MKINRIYHVYRLKIRDEWIPHLKAVIADQPIVISFNKVIARGKTLLLEWLQKDYEFARFDEFIKDIDAKIAEDVINQMMPKRLARPIQERKHFEAAYLAAQRKGSLLSGWKLRFVLYYYYGRNIGEW